MILTWQLAAGLALAASALTAMAVWLLFARKNAQQAESRQKEIDSIRNNTLRQAQEAENKALASIRQREEDIKRIQAEREEFLDARERSLEERELRQQESQQAYENRMRAVDQRAAELEDRQLTLEKLIRDQRQGLQRLTDLTPEEAKQALLNEVRREVEDELRDFKSNLMNKSDLELQAESRRILIDCMQRMAAQPNHEITATLVSLPSDDMKGRIIGREGRNIKSFESATGVTLLIDETPDSVLVSSFDPVRREIARIALQSLIKDGRIHPASIEEAVKAATQEVQRSVIEFGEQALQRLRLGRVHPEVVTLLGKLHYRLSNNQNSLEHSIEVANLCALMAAELQLDTDIAKRAGLMHDAGKSLGAEFEGSHAIAGANVLKRCGEDERVVNAVAAHHEEVEATSPYAALVMIADSLSAVRPGARADSIDAYIQRVKKLEELAQSMTGVQDAYAMQAGREIRVIINPDQLMDDDCRNLARNLRRKIEEDLQYPGTIKITVIRERRFSETAK